MIKINPIFNNGEISSTSIKGFIVFKDYKPIFAVDYLLITPSEIKSLCIIHNMKEIDFIKAINECFNLLHP
jgi:hypothetical protein